MKPTLNLNAVFQEFDLREETGVNFERDPSLALAIGQEIIDLIISRTKDNKGIGGKALYSPYSDEYAESLEFKAHGKNKFDVNMTLTGDMLYDLDILEFDGNKLKIGFEDDTEIKKAYNHNVGDTVPKRPFFGLTQSELNEVLGRFSDEIEELRKEPLEGLKLKDLIRDKAVDDFDDLNDLLFEALEDLEDW